MIVSPSGGWVEHVHNCVRDSDTGALSISFSPLVHPAQKAIHEVVGNGKLIWR